MRFTHILALGFLCAAMSSSAQNPLFIPDTLSGTNFTLDMKADSFSLLSGRKTNSYGFNQYKYLGPTLIFNQGSDVNITVNNHIGDTTTMHWHGLLVAPMNDGGPHMMIMPSMSWSPSFTVLDKASTFWYHPHFHGKTAVQAMKGAVGMLIVRDQEEAALALPRTYGKDDFPLIVQSMQLDSNNQFMPKGMQDSTLLVNGTKNPYLECPSQVIRLRLLNGSGERTFNFGFTNNKTFYLIGSDGGLLQAPVSTTRIRLSPGERAEVLLDLGGMTGQIIYLMSYASELEMGIQGGPTMPMPPGNPPMDSPINGIDFNILQINVVAHTADPVTTIPPQLVTVNRLDAAQSDITRKIEFTADNPDVMDGPFYFNGQSFDMERIDYRIPLNHTEIWELTNSTMVAHPFHIHGVQFYVLTRDGLNVSTKERGRKDVVLVLPNETVKVIAKFEHYSDSIIPYMFHCHILMHEDDGMMGQFTVMPEGWTGVNEQLANTNKFSIYPNPAHDLITVQMNDKMSGKAKLNIYDAMGRKVYSTMFDGESTLEVREWKRGMYMLETINNGQSFKKKLLLQ